jgi:diguanylate cyclase (GGDEF)-like protein
VIALLIALTASLMALPVSAGVFWISVPLALLTFTAARSAAGGAIGAVVVVAVAAGVLAARHAQPSPSPVLAALVPAASVAVLAWLRRRLERERDALRDVSLTDPLTGVANRRSLFGWAEYEIARHTREQRSFAVVMLDLDGFKSLNDRFGHAAGDEILRDVAASLRAALRGQDTLARLGGDEFCVLAPLTDRAGTGQLAKRIGQAVATATSGVDALRASLGVSVFPHDGGAVEELIEAADQRLMAAKRARRGPAPRLAA